MNNQKKRFLILIILFVIIPAIFKIASLILFDWAYLFDEVIVTNIASQGLEKIIEITKAELHPPGFYILLSFLPNPQTNALLLKSIAIIINSILWITVIFWLFRNKLLNRLNFYFLALTLSMFSTLEMNVFLKQDIISLPIFIAFLFNAYLYLYNNSKKIFIFQITLLTTILFTGYIYYLYSLAILLIINAFKTPKRIEIILWITHFLIFIFYWKLFLGEQYLINSTRFGWIEEYPNNPFYSLANFITPISELSFTQIFPFIALLSLGLISITKKASRVTIFSISILFLFAAIILLDFNLFTRPRYSILLNMTMLYIASMGLFLIRMNLISKTKNLLIVLFIVLIFLIPNSVTHTLKNIALANIKNEILETSQYTGYEIGLITQNTFTSYVFHIGYNLPKYIIPISKEHPNLNFEGNISRRMLELDGQENILTEAEISNWLQSTNLDRFIYIKEDRPLGRVYDRELRVLKVLNYSCSLETEEQMTWELKKFVFDECVFD